MKILWLCNMVPGDVKKAITGKAGNGLWVDHVLTDLCQEENITIRILCRYRQETEGVLAEGCSCRTFPETPPQEYAASLENTFAQELERFCPDVIHSWGVEYAHTLAMAKAAERTGYLDRMVISIQGLCSSIARQYCQGIPYGVTHGYTLRDLLRRDNLAMQQKKFVQRGALEIPMPAIISAMRPCGSPSTGGPGSMKTAGSTGSSHPAAAIPSRAFIICWRPLPRW